MMPMEKLIECVQVTLLNTEVQLISEGLDEGRFRYWKLKGGADVCKKVAHPEHNVDVTFNVAANVGMPHFHGYFLSSILCNVDLAN